MSTDPEGPVASPAVAVTDAVEVALVDTTDALGAPPVSETDPLPRCDCPALPVPHVHAQGGPVALEPV